MMVGPGIEDFVAEGANMIMEPMVLMRKSTRTTFGWG